jgi:hypothetical protein
MHTIRWLPRQPPSDVRVCDIKVKVPQENGAGGCSAGRPRYLQRPGSEPRELGQEVRFSSFHFRVPKFSNREENNERILPANHHLSLT